MSESGMQDKVDVHNIFKPGHGESGGIGGLAALAPALMAGRPHDGMGLGGLGAGLVGGLLGGALFGRRGGLLGGEGEGVSGLNNLQGAIDTNAILSNLADLKAAVPLAESQVQLALAGAQNDINSQGQAQTLQLMNQGFAGQLAAQTSFGDLKREVAEVGCVVDKAAWAVSQTVSNDGEKTRTAIAATSAAIMAQAQAFETARNVEKINALSAKVVELESEGRRRADHDDLRIQISNNNTAVAAQAQGQQQAQQQQQFQTINALASGLQTLFAEIQAVKQGQVIFNSGVMAASGTQAAANTRVA